MKKTKLAIFYHNRQLDFDPQNREKKTYVSEASELELDAHARNVGSTHIGSVHKRNTIHSTNSHDETAINTSNDAALLLLREAMVVIDLRADLARSLIEMIELGLLLDAVVTIGCSIHGCVGQNPKVVMKSSLSGTGEKKRGGGKDEKEVLLHNFQEEKKCWAVAPF
jgi:hypothetical protein